MSTDMKIICIEEHFADRDVAAAIQPALAELSPGFGQAYGPDSGLPHSPSMDVLTDLAEGRLAHMDEHGIDMQVLSSLTSQLLPPEIAVDLVRQSNNRLATAITVHPDRFAGFASLPTTVPAASADELRRAVNELGFVGSMVHGRSLGTLLSDPVYDDLLGCAAELRSPIYIHPAPPPVAVRNANFTVGDLITTTRFSTAGWGWHDESGLHFLHLVLAGVFDRHPDLQIILGHWGEMVPWYMERLDDTLPQTVTHLERPISDYLRHNAYVTPSGMFSQAQLDYIVRQLGTERLIMSVDYPFVPANGTREFLAAANLTTDQKAAFAHGNATTLFKLQ